MAGAKEGKAGHPCQGPAPAGAQTKSWKSWEAVGALGLPGLAPTARLPRQAGDWAPQDPTTPTCLQASALPS